MSYKMEMDPTLPKRAQIFRFLPPAYLALYCLFLQMPQADAKDTGTNPAETAQPVKSSVTPVLTSAPETPLTAFPGAAGMGAYSVGGRGGTVIKVTNLNDSGPGSFRAAAMASGPRTVVFEVSGIISLESLLYIENPYITIAGQTSPGGILIAGEPTRILTHDVIVTHMRFRKGSHGCSGETCEQQGESLFIGNGYNIIVDHCSFSWGTDEVVQVGSYWGDIRDVTVSWSTIHEGLMDPHPEDDHGYGFLISSKFYTEYAPRVSLHHNFIAHQRDRSPQMVGPVLIDLTNCVVYNFHGTLAPRAIYLHNDLPSVNFVHNYIKPGPHSNPAYPAGTGGELVLSGGGPQSSIVQTPRERIFMKGNLGMIRDDQADDEWAAVSGWSGNLAPAGWRRLTKNPVNGVPVPTTTMSEAYAEEVVEGAGATKPVRDSVDTRIITEYKNGTGTFRNDVTYPEDFPTFQNISPPTDADNDGMADSWEDGRGLNISIDDSTGDLDDDGYTNLEEYLHYLAGYQLIDTTGDINGDGAVDLTDSVLALQLASGLEPDGIILEGDADGDGRIGVGEAIMILRRLGE